MTTIRTNFNAWATSLAGCDGGDVEAPVWLCGIEWGYGHPRGATAATRTAAMNHYYDETLSPEIDAGVFQPADIYDWGDHLCYRYGQAAAKILLALHGRSVELWREVKTALPDPRVFKLNLYPIPFETTDDWRWDHYDMPRRIGLPSKAAYRTWCALHRFPALAALVRQHNPKLVIATGTEHLLEFFDAFAGKGGASEIHLDALGAPRPSGTRRSLYWARINGGRTVLAVTPFLGNRHGVNSNALCAEVGERLAAIASWPLAN